MKRRLAGCLLALLTACGGGGSGSGNEPPVEAPSFALSGRAQKGPFAIGSQISADELTASLVATGKSYKAQTSDGLGSFSFSSPLGTRLVAIQANGYYLDEIAGRLSTSVVNLQATVDLAATPTPTVNVLTSMQAARLKALMTQGAGFGAAYSQSQNEVLAAFGIDAAKVGGLTTLDAMRIDGAKDADAVLLAVSATLGQMATDASKANGTSQAAELSSLVNTIASQIGSGGAITSAAIASARKLAQTEINLSAVRSNVETYYASQSVTLVAPKFEEWVDASGSGVLPQRRTPVTGLVFTDVAGAVPATLVTSNAITVAGLGAGVSAAVAVDVDSTLIKNDVVVDGKRTIARDGDTLAIRATALGYGLARTSTLTVGASSSNWRVATQALGGTINGLVGAGLVLQLNTAESLAVPAGAGSFAFASAVANGASFSITVQTPPAGQICAITNGAGTVGVAAGAVTVNCLAAGASAIAKVSGDGQAVAQHQALPVIPKVVVTDRLGQPVSGAVVTFQASSGYYAANPVAVSTFGDGTAQVYIPIVGVPGMPFEIYFHDSGAQYVTARLPDGTSVKFDVNVSASTHGYDGKYICTDIGLGYFTVTDGQPTWPGGLPSYSTLDESTGRIEITIGSNYKAHWYGLITVDGNGRATLAGTYTASTFAGQSTDPIGNWSCYRL